jgi:multimeric flavodoxin WrbA
MKVMAFNGSPRKKDWNTLTLLKNALKGASSRGAKTELIHLYDLKYSGCIQ